MIDISADRDLRIAYKSPEKKPVSRVSRGHHGVLSFTKYIEKDEETKAFFFSSSCPEQRLECWAMGHWSKHPKGIYIWSVVHQGEMHIALYRSKGDTL